jgi:autotransporter family porin
MVPDRSARRRPVIVVAALLLSLAAGAGVALSAVLAGPAGGPLVPRVPLGDRDAAQQVTRAGADVRPENALANDRVPTRAELARYRQGRRRLPLCRRRLDLRVTGRFRGTTDEVLQWAARKWRIDPDLARAVAVVESSWRQGFTGDAGQSFGLMQVKATVHHGTFPIARYSTAFNVDFWAATIRSYYEGCATWLNRERRGRRYRAGDMWGSLGVWFAGRWWTPEARAYIRRVREELGRRRWESGTL